MLFRSLGSVSIDFLCGSIDTDPNDPSNLTSASDGILVVGGIDENAQPVTPLNYLGGYNNGTLTALDDGSNWGSAVEVWAPSQRIYSTWSGGGYQVLSGTSMAAPHIAGLASILLENNPSTILTSVDLESAVRGYFKTISGTLDGNNQPVVIASLNATAVSARANVEIVEGTPPTVNRSGANGNTINFTKAYNAVNLRFDVTGKSATNGCDLSSTYNGGAASTIQVLTTPHAITGMVPGTYYWEVKCYSWDSSATTTVTATATITP